MDVHRLRLLREFADRGSVGAVADAMRLTPSAVSQQLKVLTILVTEPEGSTIRALSAAMEVSLATMSGIVDRLESQDMIVRALDPYDQRVRRVDPVRQAPEAATRSSR